MLDIAVRLVATFMKHPDHGVNVLAQLLPRANLGGGPDDAAPAVVAIFNDAEDKTVAANLDPEEVPALVVWGDSAADIEVRGYPTAKEIVIGAGFVTSDDADPTESVRNCGYILRAGRQCLTRYNSGDMSEGYRVLNGIKITQVTGVTEQRITAAVGSRKLWGLLEIRATVVDLLP